MAKRDPLTADLFEIPTPVEPRPGSLNFNKELRRLLSDLLKKTPPSVTREVVAARMSELTGDTVTKHMIDAWTAESREGWRFPLEYAPAFEVAVETTGLLAWFAQVRGGKALIGKDALDAEIGKLERWKEEANQEIKRLKHTRRLA